MKTTRLDMAKVLGAALLLGAAVQVPAQNVTVDLNTTYQTIRGFGGMNHRIWTGYDLNASDRNLAFGNGAGQIGMTVLRIWISDKESDWAIELPTAKDVISRGGIVFATPWNPPAAMTETVTRNGRSEKRLKPASYAEYAAHLNKFAKYMKDNGVPLTAISFANEPDWGYDWTWWSIDEVYNFAKNNASVLRENGTKVITAESFAYSKSYYDKILNDAAALKNVDIIGAHFYASDAKSANSFYQYPLADGKGKERWMTEHYTDSKGDANLWKGYIQTSSQDAPTVVWDTVRAYDVGYEIHRALVEGQFNAYTWWYIRRDYGPIKNSDGTVSKRGYCMAQYAKFVRPGAVRVDATKEPITKVNVSAFTKQDSVVIVVVNRNVSKTLNISVPAATGIKSWRKYTTSATKNVNDDGAVAATNGSFSTAFDQESITTLVGVNTTAAKVPPVVKFTAPVATGSYVSGSPIGVDVTATDADGTVSRIEFYDGATLVHTEWPAPYAWSWADAAAGTHVLKAIAYDNDGNSAQDSVTIAVKNGTVGIGLAASRETVVHQVHDLQGNRIGEVVTDGGSSLQAAVGRMVGRPGIYLARHATEQGMVTRKVEVGLP